MNWEKNKKLTKKEKKLIDKIIAKVMKEYGEVLKKLSKE